MSSWQSRFSFCACLAVLAWPAVCMANVGVPMIGVTLPGMTVALIPIVVLEALIARAYVKLTPGRLLLGSGVANLVSTFVGIPLTWGVLLGLQIISGGGRAHGLSTPLERFLAVTWQAPWLVPYQGELDWMVPAAAMVLLIPFYFASWGCEYVVLKRLWREADCNAVKWAAAKVNLASYLGLALVLAVWLWG